jgi:hypothetical protein
MRPSLLVLFLVAVETQPACGASGEEALVDTIVQQVKAGGKAEFSLASFKNPHEAAVGFAERLGLVTASDHRLVIIGYVVALEKQALLEAPRSTSDSAAVLACLTKAMRDDRSESVRALAAKALREFYPPAVLDVLATEIKGALRTWREDEILLLYGVLPSARQEELQEVVGLPERPPRISQTALDGALARVGDLEAQERLVLRARSVEDVGLADLEKVFGSLAYVGSSAVKQECARGLRSENVLKLPGGGTMPKRNLYAYGLVLACKGEPSFPMKTAKLLWSDREFDSLETWCTKQLGIGFPGTPRKSLFPVPSVEPPAPAGAQGALPKQNDAAAGAEERGKPKDDAPPRQ